MKYTTIRLGAALLASSFIISCTSNADAGWGHLRGGGSTGGGSVGAAYGSGGGYGSGGYTASYGSGGNTAYGSYGAAYGSYGGSRGRPGILRRVVGGAYRHLAAKRARHRARRASYGRGGGYAGYSSYGGGSTGGYRSYGSTGYGSSASYGSVGAVSSYGSTGSYSSGVSYGSIGSAGYGSGSVGYGNVGSGYYGASNASASSASSLVSDLDISDDAVYLTVSVPDDAKVFVNGVATTSTGEVRQFVSRGLKPGKSYTFDVRAELESADGKQTVDSKSVVVSAGQREQVQFAFDEQNSPVQTAVTLNVPEGAIVRLSGNQTEATGTVRTFHTSQLKAGEVWDEYEIQVQLGDEVKNRSIRLIGGDDLQLTFAFDSKTEKLASR